MNKSDIHNNAEFNRYFRSWASKVRRKLRSSARWFSDGKSESFVTRGIHSGNVRQEKKLANSIRTRMKQDYGRYDSVSFNFERHGVFIHKGVGRGYKQTGSFVTRTAKSDSTKSRIAVDWFNPTLNDFLPELADKVAEMDANAALNAFGVNIK
jgi:hypothetical protein